MGINDKTVPLTFENARTPVPLSDDRACQVGNPDRITAAYNRANKATPKDRYSVYYGELKSVLFSIIANGAHPFTLSDLFSRAVQMGLPIDPNALFADEKVLAMEARYMALCIPTLKNIHLDCKLWLAEKLKKPVEKIEGSIPWNCMVGGVPI
jgi:hypothetical protein